MDSDRWSWFHGLWNRARYKECITPIKSVVNIYIHKYCIIWPSPSTILLCKQYGKMSRHVIGSSLIDWFASLIEHQEVISLCLSSRLRILALAGFVISWSFRMESSHCVTFMWSSPNNCNQSVKSCLHLKIWHMLFKGTQYQHPSTHRDENKGWTSPSVSDLEFFHIFCGCSIKFLSGIRSSSRPLRPCKW